MIGTEDQMLLLIDESALALSEIAPKHENGMRCRLRHGLNDRVGQHLPAQGAVTCSLSSPHRQNGIQKEHPLMRPGQKRSLLSHGHAQIPMQLLLDVAKRRWNLDACGHGKGKPFGLSRTVIGVLPQNHDPDPVRRRLVHGTEYTGRINLMSCRHILGHALHGSPSLVRRHEGLNKFMPQRIRRQRHVRHDAFRKQARRHCFAELR